MMDEVYTTREAGRVLGLTSYGVRNAIKLGQLKAEKFGTNYAITREALEEYLEFREARKHGKR